MSNFYNQVAVITGAGKGIGKEIARTLGLEGAFVCLLDSDGSALDQSCNEFKEQHIAFEKFNIDITNEFDVAKVFNSIKETHGKIDVLVNNAGFWSSNLASKTGTDEWEQVMDSHLKGTFLCSKYAQEIMINNSYGRIINLSSASVIGNEAKVDYVAVKMGIQGFTKTLALHLGQYNITVNAVAPGFIPVEVAPFFSNRHGMSFEQLKEKEISRIPMKRGGVLKDVAHAVCFFASKGASFISGQVLDVAGGPKDY